MKNETFYGQVVFVEKNLSLMEAAHRMEAEHALAAIVVPKRSLRPMPLGMIEYEEVILFLQSKRSKNHNYTVADVLHPIEFTLKAKDTFSEKLQCLYKGGATIAPVVDGKNSVVGIFSLSYAIHAVAHDLGLISRIESKHRKRQKCVASPSSIDTEDNRNLTVS